MRLKTDTRAARKAIRTEAGGRARIIAGVRDRMRELARSCREVGLDQIASELEGHAKLLWENADKMYITILSLTVEQK